MTSYPFIFYTALVFPIPSAFKAAEGMQLLFSFVDEMMTVLEDVLYRCVGVCARVKYRMYNENSMEGTICN